MTGWRRSTIAVVTLVLTLVGCVTLGSVVGRQVAAAAAPAAVTCQLDGQTLSCTLPAAPTVTQTVTATVTASAASSSAASSSSPAASSTPPAGGVGWLSGASGAGVPNGDFGRWRGTPVPLCATWSDADAGNQLNSWQFNAGGEYGTWAGSCDWAPGAIFAGETWAKAAAGAYDARWRDSIRDVKADWQRISRGTLYVRPAHEMNGTWMPWSVKPADVASFKAAWVRYHDILAAEFPAAKLVFSTNGNTVGQAYDWRTLWPGDAYVDVYSTDWYSLHFQFGADGVDSYGGPTGLDGHRKFAEAHGVPFAVSEWGNNTDAGDRPDYIAWMHQFFTAHAGTGPGQVLYEAYFNVIWSPNKFGLYPTTNAPKSRDQYVNLF